MTDRNLIRVEVVFALPDRQELLALDVAKGSNCAEAIRQSRIAERFPQVDLASLPVAIWGRPVDQGELLGDGDRVEILRPLQMDPRDARRQRAMAGQFMDGSSADETDSRVATGRRSVPDPSGPQ